MKPFRQFADIYVQRLQAGRAARAVSQAKTSIGAFVRWLEEQRIFSPNELRTEHIVGWLTHASARLHYRSGMPRKAFSIFSEARGVRTFVATLVEEGALPGVILGAFPKLRSPAILPRVVLKHAEVNRVIRGVPGHSPRLHMLRTMMETAYSTAVRPCELLRMDVRDVQAERGLIRVLGKGNKERMLPIGRHAHRMLLNYVRGVRPLLQRRPEEKALWLTVNGARLGYAGLLDLLNLHVNGNQRERITWYSFRRACATELARSGANIWAIKELLGHEHLETVKHYVHFSLDDLKRAHARCHPRNLPANSKDLTPKHHENTPLF